MSSNKVVSLVNPIIEGNPKFQVEYLQYLNVKPFKNKSERAIQVLERLLRRVYIDGFYPEDLKNGFNLNLQLSDIKVRLVKFFRDLGEVEDIFAKCKEERVLIYITFKEQKTVEDWFKRAIPHQDPDLFNECGLIKFEDKMLMILRDSDKVDKSQYKHSPSKLKSQKLNTHDQVYADNNFSSNLKVSDTKKLNNEFKKSKLQHLQTYNQKFKADQCDKRTFLENETFNIRTLPEYKDFRQSQPIKQQTEYDQNQESLNNYQIQMKNSSLFLANETKAFLNLPSSVSLDLRTRQIELRDNRYSSDLNDHSLPKHHVYNNQIHAQNNPQQIDRKISTFNSILNKSQNPQGELDKSSPYFSHPTNNTLNLSPLRVGLNQIGFNSRFVTNRLIKQTSLLDSIAMNIELQTPQTYKQYQSNRVQTYDLNNSKLNLGNVREYSMFDRDLGLNLVEPASIHHSQQKVYEELEFFTAGKSSFSDYLKSRDISNIFNHSVDNIRLNNSLIATLKTDQ